MILGLDAWIFWLLLAIILLIIEVVTTRLTTIWPAAGSLVGLVLDLMQVEVIFQIITMLIVSIGLIILFQFFLRPRSQSATDSKVHVEPGKFIGMEAVVVETIDPIDGSGLIKASGQIWRAGSSDNQVIEQGAVVEIVEMHGVRAVVRSK